MIEMLKTGRIFNVTGATWKVIEDHLNEAVERARNHAADEGLHGILVTRQKGDAFTVEISEDVAYGTTLERWE